MGQFDSIRFQPGRPLLKELGAERLNAIVTEIKRNKPKGERGITVRQDGTGTYIGLAASLPRGGGGGTPATLHPFQIFSNTDPDSNPESPSFLVTVRPGTINALLPTNILDGGGLVESPIPNDSLRYVTLTASSDGEQITTAAVSVDTSAPAAQTPEIFGLPSEAKILLGLVFGSRVFQTITNSITVTGKQQFITSKANAAVGELPYNIHYVWG